MKIIKRFFSKLIAKLKGVGGYTQKTSGAGLTNLIMSYYDRVLLETIIPELKYYQFADKKSLPKSSGKTITFNQYKKLSAVTTAITEGTVPSQVVLSTTKIAATLIQYGGYTKLSDIVKLTTIDDTVANGIRRLAEQAAETVDTYIRDRVSIVVANAAQRSALSKLYTDTSMTSGVRVRIFSGLEFEDGFPIRHNKGRISTSTSVTAIAASSMSVATIRDAVGALQLQNVKPFKDGYYVGIAHPVTVNQLRGTNNWQSWQKYTNPEMMYKGEVGFVEGVRIVQSTNAPKYTLSGDGLLAGSGYLYGTTVFGRQAFGVTEIAGNKAVQTFVVPPNKFDSSNPLQQWTTIGWKVTMAARILNKSAGVNIITTSTTGG